jgi:predicted outer membrane repeat protein
MYIFSRSWRIVLLVVIGVSLAGAGGVRAAPQDVTITVNTLDSEAVGDGNCGLREAMLASTTNIIIDACPAGDSVGMDTIVFAVSGTILLTYALPTVGNNGPLTIDGGNTISVSGNNSTNIFDVDSEANLTLQNLTVTQGYLSGSAVGGAALHNQAGTVTIENCIFSDNTGSGNDIYGGAIHINTGSLTISNSTFTNNTASDYRVYGGVIFAVYSSLTISNSTFQDNSVSGDAAYGGVIDIDGGDLNISATTFSGNSAASLGGAIVITGWNAEITGSTFQDNAAISNGGAIYHSYGALSISGSTFDGNSTWNDGGAIFCNGGMCTIEGSTFTDNTALDDGGAISSSGDVTLNLDGDRFSGNSALYDGGAVLIVASPDFSITNTTFESNSASQGGGLSVTNTKGSISDSLFRKNNGDLGGGIYYYATDFEKSGLTLQRTTLWENDSQSGGAVYNEYAHLMMINDSLASNTAEYGAGVYNTNGGLLEILNSTLAYNSAVTQGDQICRHGGAVYTSNSIYASGESGQNCYGDIMDSGHNIDSGNTCGFNTGNGSMNNTDPILGPLQDNGGPGTPGYGTLTFALQYASPAINNGDPSLYPDIDQRGSGRRSGYCDIGSYEAQPYAFYVNSGDWQSTYVDSYFPEPLVMEAQDEYGNRLAGVWILLDAPDSGASLANIEDELLTGADGSASFDALANGIPGGWYEVIAQHCLSSVYTTFHLTNLALPDTELYFFLPMLMKY